MTIRKLFFITTFLSAILYPDYAKAAANLFPGYFALVMATGIISIAAYLLGMRSLAWALLGINVVASWSSGCYC